MFEINLYALLFLNINWNKKKIVKQTQMYIESSNFEENLKYNQRTKILLRRNFEISEKKKWRTKREKWVTFFF